MALFGNLDVTLDIDALDLQADTIQAAPDALQAYVEQTVVPASQQRTDATINAEPGPHQRPTDWQTTLQQRWWFGVGRFQWTGRTGNVRAWKVLVERIDLGAGEIRAENPVPESRWVFLPPFQQRMHATTWTNADTWAEQEAPQVADDVVEGWYEVNGVNGP